MRSIRRSLTIYMLSLFALAIAGVGFLADRIVVNTLTVRRQAAEDRIKEQYDDRCRERRQKIDDKLAFQARALGLEMNTEYFKRSAEEGQRFGAFATAVNFGTAPVPHPLPLLVWVTVNAERTPFDRGPSVGGRLFRQYTSNLKLDPQYVTSVEQKPFPDGDPTDEAPHYFQINSTYGSVWRSKSLGDMALPLDIRQPEYGRLAFWEWRMDSVPAPSGRMIRRVVLKAPIGASFRFPTPRRPTGDRPSTPTPGVRLNAPQPPPPPPTFEQIMEQTPRVYVTAAREVLPDHMEYADHIAWQDEELLKEAEVSRQTLLRIRAILVGIALLGFVAVAVGGPFLVRRGLAPVEKLSNAVSLVSARDFRLPVERSEMSQELAPIHDRLTHALDELKLAFEREKQAVADISHELRTPVAALLTTMEVSLRKPRTADQYRQTLDECRAITKQLGQLVERVMTLAYLDAGQTVLKPTAVEAGELIEGCAAVIRPLAEAHGVTFRVQPATEPVELHTDRDKLREVLMNLLHNAVEYSNRGDTVELAVGTANGHVEFAVKDTGIGMTEEVKDRIFERFYRADPSRTETGVHAGLGLAIVKEYVERLGGHIRVVSAPGQGSTFAVELPA